MITRALILVALLLTSSEAWAFDHSLKSPRDLASYALGVNIVGNLKQQGGEIDPEIVLKGMKDSFSGGKLLMSEEEIRKYISIYQSDLRNRQAKSRTAAAEANSKAGAAFLEQNRRKGGVVALPSGLQYRVLREGSGRKPTDTDTVEFHYRTSSINGTEMESSYRTGQPALRKVRGGVVPGLAEALKLMPVGSKWQLFVPPRLAYAERGSGKVGPQETVVFEVELLGVK